MQNQHTQKLGFIGLGLMGKPMSRNLIQAGCDLFVTNRSAQPRMEIAAAGATPLETPGQVAARADTIIIMVADTAAVESILLGENGVIHRMGGTTLVIDMGTTSVNQTRRFAELISEKGGLYVDAPVSGGSEGAENGTLTIMVRGEASDMQHVRPVLEAMGKTITHNGNGSHFRRLR